VNPQGRLDVLVVSSKFHPEYSGSGFRADSLYRRLSSKQSFKWEVLCGGVEYRSREQFTHDGIRACRICFDFPYSPGDGVLRLPTKIVTKLNAILEFFAAYRFISQTKPKLIHAFGKGPVVAAALYWSKLNNRPVILELCNRMSDPHVDVPIISRIYRPSLSSRVAIVAISRELKELCQEFGYTANVWHRPNPVRTSIGFIPIADRKRIREKLRVCDRSSDKVLVYLAKFMPQKNQRFLLDVLSALPDEYQLILAGPVAETGVNATRDQDYLRGIEHQIDVRPGLTGRVKIWPRFVEASEIFSIGDLYLFPAWNEALGTPMLEALVAGLPVIANQGEPAFVEWLADCPTGALCPLEVEAWVSQITRLIDVSEGQRLEVSNRIKSLASERVIDKGYSCLIQSMLVSGATTRQVNVKQIFETCDL
jgi:glycosyltransferase involved in cell wall biosynthesis